MELLWRSFPNALVLSFGAYEYICSAQRPSSEMKSYSMQPHKTKATHVLEYVTYFPLHLFFRRTRCSQWDGADDKEENNDGSAMTMGSKPDKLSEVMNKQKIYNSLIISNEIEMNPHNPFRKYI